MNTLIGAYNSSDFNLTAGSAELHNEIPAPPPHKCKNQVLLKNNYLSEFFTKADREKVLKNLGITEVLTTITK